MKKIIKTFILIVVFSICLINFTSCKTNKDITITLYPNNGDETKVIKAKANEKIQLPEIPQTEGYFFVGWFLDQQFKQKVGFPATFKEDVVLYGGWQTLVQYELDEKTDTYQVTGVVFSHYNITILETYHGKKVTAIKEEAFKDNGTIMNIKLPDTIKTIGDRAFMNMRYLMNINLPDGLEEIGNDIFLDSEMIYYEDLNGLQYLNNWLIKATTAKTESIKMKETTVGIFPSAFKDNIYIKEITIPSTITKIAADTFRNSSITTLNIHKDVTYIDETALISTEQLTAINVDEDNQVYESLNGVLYSKGLKTLIKYPSARPNKTVTLPAVVERISASAFDNCKNLEEITITDNTRYIGPLAFNNSQKLKIVNLPNTLQEIGSKAFQGCIALEKLEISRNCKLGKQVLNGCESLKKLTIPFIIQDEYFYDGTYLFGTTKINVTELMILGGTKLVDKALSDFTSLVTLSLPNTIQVIESLAFDGLNNLKVLNFEGNDYYKIINEVLYTSDGKKLLYYLPTNTNTQFTTPLAVEEITSNAFSNANNICMIELTENVKIVRSHAFVNLENLSNIIFSGNLDVVEEDICVGTPNVHMYFKDKMPNSNWSEGFNTYNYKTTFNITEPKVVYTNKGTYKDKVDNTIVISYFVYGLETYVSAIKIYDEDGGDVTADNLKNSSVNIIEVSFKTSGSYQLVITIDGNSSITTTVSIKIND